MDNVLLTHKDWVVMKNQMFLDSYKQMDAILSRSFESRLSKKALRGNKWEDSLLVSKQSCVTGQNPSHCISNNKESDQIKIKNKNKMPTAFIIYTNFKAFPRYSWEDIMKYSCLYLNYNIYSMAQ